MRAKLLVSVVLAGAVALAACGGGGSGTTTTKTANAGPTKAEYIASTSGICKQTESRLNPLIHQLTGAVAGLLTGGAGASKAVATTVEKVYAIAASGLAKLRALPQPAADHAAIAKFLTPLGTIVDSMRSAIQGLKQGQGAQAIAQLQADQTPAQQVTSAAKKYGLRQCQTIFSALG
ncbi:MAG TPA: hypothetical protein VGG41_21050 [Solirubrobacteraceae bacterium]|jgi:hypothetical protein